MKKPLLVIVGATATGKSDLAVSIARDFDCEIVNADSTQVYKGLDIGTGKIPADKRKGIKHHLMDVIPPEKDFSAGDFKRLADKAISGILNKGKIPLVVGGTGLYIRSLLNGLASLPERNETLRKRLRAIAEKKGELFLYRMLERVDPVYALKIERRDRQRIVRALEVFFLTGEQFSEFHKKHGFERTDFNAFKIGLFMPREELYKRIEERTRIMFQSGWVKEVQELLERGIREDANALKAIGYREILRYIKGSAELEETIDATIKETRRYAKRQITWFMKEEGVLWYDVYGEGLAETLRRIRGDVRQWLAEEGVLQAKRAHAKRNNT